MSNSNLNLSSNLNLNLNSTAQNNIDSDFATYLLEREDFLESQIEELFNLDKQKLKEKIDNYKDYFKQEEIANGMDDFLKDKRGNGFESG